LKNLRLPSKDKVQNKFMEEKNKLLQMKEEYINQLKNVLKNKPSEEELKNKIMDSQQKRLWK
jgi:hypothetical protein